MTKPEHLKSEREKQILYRLESELVNNSCNHRHQTTSSLEIIANPFLRQYILLGYGAKGIIYCLIGMLAIEAAILPERQAAGTYNALKHLSGQPLGSVSLCLLAVCLLGYVLRRLLQAIIYPGHNQGFNFTSILRRLGYVASSISYAGIAYSAVIIALKLGKYNNRIQAWVEHLLDRVIAGEAIVFAAGIAVTGVGIGYLYGAYTGSYISKFASSEIDRRLEYWATWMGKVGISARGIAFIVTGNCLMLASLAADSHLAGGLQKAFRVLAQQPFGWLWLGAIGLSFIAYGLYMLITARYRRYTIR